LQQQLEKLHVETTESGVMSPDSWSIQDSKC
jgi:hypothetical protein